MRELIPHTGLISKVSLPLSLEKLGIMSRNILRMSPMFGKYTSQVP